jgi:multiubiquitin
MGRVSTVLNEKEGHDAKITEIVVNGQKKEFAGKEISYREVVELAFENPWGNPNVIYTVTYTRGHDDKPQGTLVDGQSVKVKKGMVFNVTRTDKS